EWEDDTTGAAFSTVDVPEELRARAEEARAAMVEAIAEVDDEVMALFLDGKAPPVELLRAALRRATIAGHAVPVLLGPGLKNKGVQPLLDAVVDYLPAPSDIPPVTGKDADGHDVARIASDEQPFSALAFKIMNDPFVGSLTYFRVYSGKVEAGSTV